MAIIGPRPVVFGINIILKMLI